LRVGAEGLRGVTVETVVKGAAVRSCNLLLEGKGWLRCVTL
jgi:hypothetical protein